MSRKKSSASTGVEILYGINFTHRPGVAGFECAFARRLLERHPYSQLRRKRNPHRRSGAKEISQRALGYLKLFRLVMGAVCEQSAIAQTLVTLVMPVTGLGSSEPPEPEAGPH